MKVLELLCDKLSEVALLEAWKDGPTLMFADGKSLPSRSLRSLNYPFGGIKQYKCIWSF